MNTIDHLEALLAHYNEAKRYHSSHNPIPLHNAQQALMPAVVDALPKLIAVAKAAQRTCDEVAPAHMNTDTLWDMLLAQEQALANLNTKETNEPTV